MESDDPWDWSVDRVVQELCTEQRSWPAWSKTQRLPDPTKFQNLLRELEVDGSLLLTGFYDSNELRTCCNLRESTTVRHMISFFRRKSPSYRDFMPAFGDLSHADYTPTIFDGDSSRNTHRTPAKITTLHASTTIATGVHHHTADHLEADISLSEDADPVETEAGEVQHGKRRKVAGAANRTEVEYLPSPVADSLTSPEIQSKSLDPVGDTTDLGVQDSSPTLRKRKRIAPTLITPYVTSSLHTPLPSAADSVVLHVPHSREPGVVFRGDDGRKRLIPIPSDGISKEWLDQCQTHQNSLKPDLRPSSPRSSQSRDDRNDHGPRRDNTSTATTILNKATETGYLGKSNYTIDEVFYNKIAIGSEMGGMDEVVELTYTGTGIPAAGRCLYINSLMKHYLRSSKRKITRNGKTFSLQQPYSKLLIPIHQSVSFTLFTSTDHGIIATREALSRWPEVEDSATAKFPVNDDERRALFDLPDICAIGGPSSYDNWDASLLEKYRYVDGGDAVLPLYGDSDDENDYDEETWREIEAEHGKQEKPVQVSKKPALSFEAVNSAIDEGVAQLVSKWHQKKLPKRDGWKLWQKCQKQNSKGLHIRKANHLLSRIDEENLPKLRKAITDEHWTSQSQVRKITANMEQTVFNREDLLWQLSILERKTPPPRVETREERPTISKPSAQRVELAANSDGEESLNSSSEDDSMDDLSSFIVGDDSQEESDIMQVDADDDDLISEHEPDHDVRHPHKLKEPESEDRGVGPAATVTAKITIIADADVRMKDEYSTPSNQNRRRFTSSQSTRGLVDLTKIGPVEDGETSLIQALSPSSNDSPPPTQFKNPFAGVEQLIRCKNSASQPIEISDDEDVSSVILSPATLPALDDVVGIANYPATFWSGRRDRERLLLGQLHALEPRMRRRLTKLLTSPDIALLWDDLMRVVEAMINKTGHLVGLHEAVYAALTNTAWLFSMYVECRYITPSRSITTEILQNLKKSKHLFTRFIDLASTTLNALRIQCMETLAKNNPMTAAQEEAASSEHSVCDTVPETVLDATADAVAYMAPETNVSTVVNMALPAHPTANSEDSEEEIIPSSRVRSRILSTSGEDGEEQIGVSPRKKKRKLVENVHAKTLREQDHLRLSQQDERRRILRRKLAFSHVDVAKNRIIVNEAKTEDEGFVYIDKQIQTQIKEHQVDGVRFMWEQILSQQRQGCLLAHTMGLGKTMQVITLLVAVAEAARSTDESVSSQIPKSLRTSQTLVLCPPGLIDNWMDELLIWAPGGSLGHLRKVDSTMTLNVRLDIISDWFCDGGILVLGYEMFREMMENKTSRLRPEAHEDLKEWLLDGPRIVVADEAHKMKNIRTALTRAASQFRTNTRLALTGSPLANNVEEYHTMIDWVAPNYLGPIEEFRIKYVEPIQSGLYADSTSFERRTSLKMLGVLKEDLAPKVHRADISVLKSQLKPKKEFIITVALTELQIQAYTLYVQSIWSGNGGIKLTKSGEFKQTTVWAWLSVLSLLCNHPECFKDKLESDKDKLEADRDEPHKAVARHVEAEDEIVGDDATPVWKTGLSQDLIRDEMALFQKYGPAFQSIEQSNKVAILVQILDESKAAGDKVLVFSQSIPTLDYLERLCMKSKRLYARLDGSTQMSKRQGLTKDFNSGKTELYLISTAAGGLGLNLPGANRVVIFDFKYNPIMEEQAIGRAYRIGQTKPVYVYRFIAGGTFEGNMHNRAVFKTQLASRVVDKKSVVSWAKKKVGEFLFEPKDVVQEDLSEHLGKDPAVLDKILARQGDYPNIRAIVMTDTFERHDTDVLTPEEEKEVKRIISEKHLERTNPAAFNAMMAQRSAIVAGQRQHIVGRDVRSVPDYTPMGMLPTRGLPLSIPVAPSPAMVADQVSAVHSIKTGAVLPGDIPLKVSTLSVTPLPEPPTTPRDSTLPELTPVAGANTLIWHPTLDVADERSRLVSDTVAPALKPSPSVNGSLQHQASMSRSQTGTPKMQPRVVAIPAPSLPTMNGRSKGGLKAVAHTIKPTPVVNASLESLTATSRSQTGTTKMQTDVLPALRLPLHAMSERISGGVDIVASADKSTPNAKHSLQHWASVLPSQTATPQAQPDVARALRPSLTSTSRRSGEGLATVSPTVKSTPNGDHDMQTRVSTLRSRSSTPRTQSENRSTIAPSSTMPGTGSKDSSNTPTRDLDHNSSGGAPIEIPLKRRRVVPSTELLGEIGQAELARFVPRNPVAPKPSSSQLGSQTGKRTLPWPRQNTSVATSKNPANNVSKSKTPSSSSTPQNAAPNRPRRLGIL